MQFCPDIELAIRKPFTVRKLNPTRKLEVLDFLHKFRVGWHQCRASAGISSSKIWLEKRKSG